ncbi:MAG: hypothetical protein RLZZ628_2026 [Bacteroidota bacterium]|jgi:hypothetical protein
MSNNVYYKTMTATKAANQKVLKFPSSNTIGSAHILGCWIRRNGKVAESEGEICTDAVKNGHLTLKSHGETVFDPLPVDIIATVNELSGAFFSIELSNIDWLGSEIKYDAPVNAEIEVVFKFLK